MKYALKLLRKQLNLERAFLSQYNLHLKAGRKIGLTRHAQMSQRLRENRIISLQQAIHALKGKGKIVLPDPVYYWTPDSAQMKKAS